MGIPPDCVKTHKCDMDESWTCVDCGMEDGTNLKPDWALVEEKHKNTLAVGAEFEKALKDHERNPMKDKIKKLPKWAQVYIDSLEIERDAAVKTLNRSLDDQTPSDFYIDDFVHTGEDKGPTVKRRYFQAHRMTVGYKDVQLDIYLRGADGIELSWSDLKRHGREVAFVPSSYQKARLVSQDCMRR
jgi:hypothetical protein